jgi:hypothetical protein
MTSGRTGRVRLVAQVGVVGLLTLWAAACGSNGATSSTSTTAATTRTTETFSGTVSVGGSDFHGVSIAAAGTIDVTLTAAAPPSNIVMTISVGLPVNGTCVPLAGATTNAAAGSAVQLSGVASPGTLCVAVRDAGNQTATVSYTISVTHP